MLKGGWAKACVGDLAEYVNGRAFKPTEWKDAGKPIIRIQNLNKRDAKYNYSPLGHEDKYLVKNGDLLFAWSASLGAYIWNGEEAWLNQHIFKVIPKNSTTKIFVYYLLVKITTELYAKAHGSGMVHVTKGKFESTEISLPPLNEQHRIVAKIEELFSELDNGIASLKAAQQQLKTYRQALLKHAFEGKLTAEWRAQNKDKLESTESLLARIAQERTQRYQQQLKDWEEPNKKIGGKQGSKPKAPKTLPPLTVEELGGLPGLPEGWGWGKLGLMTCGVEYGTSAKSLENGSCPVLRMGNIQNGKFDLSDLVYTNDKDEIAKYLLKVGNVLFNRTNSPELVGKAAIFKSKYPAIFAGYLIRVNQIPTIIQSEFLNYFLNSHTAKQHGNKVKTDGVNQSNINGEKLVNYPFPFCSLSEQKLIVDILDSKLSEVDQLEQTILTSIQQAESLRQSILKKAFSGQLVAQDASDEPASVLLARIKMEKAKQATEVKPRKPQKTDRQEVVVKTNVLNFPTKIPNISATDLHAGIIAMALNRHEEGGKLLHFGHVKAEKISHLIESHLGIDLERAPIKDAAGPNDYPHLKKVESRARKANWFDVEQQQAEGAYTFTKKYGFDALVDKTAKALADKLADVDKLLTLLLPLNTKQAEIVATLYAAWNNLLLLGQSPTDEQIVYEARENWHESKLGIEKEKFTKGLQWMRDKELIPLGTGEYIDRKGKKS